MFSVCRQSGHPLPEMYKRHQTVDNVHPLSAQLSLRGWVLGRKSQEDSAYKGNWVWRSRFSVSTQTSLLRACARSVWILRDGAFIHQSISPILLRLCGTAAMAPWRETPSPLPSKAVEQDTAVPSFPPSFKYKFIYPPCVAITEHGGLLALETLSVWVIGSLSFQRV